MIKKKKGIFRCQKWHEIKLEEQIRADTRRRPHESQMELWTPGARELDFQHLQRKKKMSSGPKEAKNGAELPAKVYHLPGVLRGTKIISCEN